jgi:hypothetical protein
MTEKRQDAIANQVSRGEIARDQQQVASDDDLALGQPVPRLVNRNEGANEITAAAPATLVDCPGEIILKGLPRQLQLGRLLGGPSNVEDLRSRIRPALELHKIASVDPQHLGDHNDR